MTLELQQVTSRGPFQPQPLWDSVGLDENKPSTQIRLLWGSRAQDRFMYILTLLFCWLLSFGAVNCLISPSEVCSGGPPFAPFSFSGLQSGSVVASAQIPLTPTAPKWFQGEEQQSQGVLTAATRAGAKAPREGARKINVCL